MTPKEKIAELKKEVESIEQQARLKRAEIYNIENTCIHVWSQPLLNVRQIHYGEGSFGGSYEQREWERECSNCGKKQTTQRESFAPQPMF